MKSTSQGNVSEHDVGVWTDRHPGTLDGGSQIGIYGNFNMPDNMLGGSVSRDGSKDGDYTESDSEGEEAYKAGGYHPVQIGEVYNNRYKVVCKLGWGHFSTVWLAEDLSGTSSTGRVCYVALKIQKSASHYTEAAYDEIELLSRARNARNSEAWKKSRIEYVEKRVCPDASIDPEYTGVIALRDFFETKGPNGVHVCMVFETMGPNALTLIKKYDFKGVPIDVVRKLATDCLVGLDYLHRICGIIHTDLKPENVLVCCPVGIPVNKTGQALVPLDKPIDVTGQHFEQLPACSRSKPVAPMPPKEWPKVPLVLSRNQRRKIAKKNKPKKRPKPKQFGDGDSHKDPPYVKSLLKPSRSDPSLLTFYTKQAASSGGLHRPPYHHPRSLYERAKHICKTVIASKSNTASSSTTVSEDMISQMDIFNHGSVAFKLADLGNACWVERHFSEDIQTRQYRAPEVLIGSGYDTSADIWSLACMIFELVTGDYLFDPKGSDEFPRDEDHLALIMELVGPLPNSMIAKGKKSATYFNKKNELRHIKQLRLWPLQEVLHQKYRLTRSDAECLAQFLLPMLRVDPTERATAADLLNHPWLHPESSVPPKFPRMKAPVVSVAPDADREDEAASEVVLNSPGFSSARSEIL